MTRAQTSLIFNVIVGIVFIVIITLFYIVNNAMINDIKYNDVKDTQERGILVTYLGVISKLEPEDIDEFSKLNVFLNDNPNYFSKGSEFENFQNEVLKATERESDTFICNRASFDAFSYITYTNSNQDIAIFYMCGLFVEKDNPLKSENRGVLQ